MRKHHHRCLLLLSLGLLIFSSCSSYDTRLNAPASQYIGINGINNNTSNISLSDRISYWDGDNASGAPSMVIDLSDQRLYYYRGGKLVGVASACTGKEGNETKRGHYKIIQKDIHHTSSEYGDFVDKDGNIVVKNVSSKIDVPPPGSHFVGAPMPYFMRIYGGVGMHAGFLPGIPDSHGCIRLPDKMAKIFFETTPLGTPVTVKK